MERSFDLTLRTWSLEYGIECIEQTVPDFNERKLDAKAVARRAKSQGKDERKGFNPMSRNANKRYC